MLGSFGLIFAYAFNVEGGGGMAQNLLEWQYQCSLQGTLEADKKKRSDKFNNDLHNLMHKGNVLMCWNDFQKFIPIKFLQQEGQSVTDTYCTVQYAKKVNMLDKFIPKAQQQQPKKVDVSGSTNPGSTGYAAV